ncbi:hypothetical protein MPDQ_007980 [Monascus purpureus]|uniref:Uncharacterized protein n=1 Tax=Monascus purpureus TaxID=5098 RepID=A0A507QSR7_MONPU|nr:hypothetical protein MPDQ_007980 [Monascus purpureus]BDD62431.1 hypothetical protein MAP00_007399 [Monascus purpureus]
MARRQRSKQYKCSNFVECQSRLLTVMEYVELLSLSPDQKSLDRGKFPNDVNSILADCSGLASIDEESTMRYVHQSVKIASFGGKGPHTDELDTTSVDHGLSFLCMTYLNLTSFKRDLAKFKKDFGVGIMLQWLIFEESVVSSDERSVKMTCQ